MTSPLPQAPAICPEEGVDLIQDLLQVLVLILGLALAQAAGAKATIILNKMIASQAQPPSVVICTPRTMRTDITITQTRVIPFLPSSLLQRQQEVIAPRNRSRESHQQSMNSCNV